MFYKLAAPLVAAFCVTVSAIPIGMATSPGRNTRTFEGVEAVAAASINPPNPVTSCENAKQDARVKAQNAGYTRLVSWARQSNDSDCQLTTQGKPGVSYFFIFTAKGNFAQ